MMAAETLKPPSKRLLALEMRTVPEMAAFGSSLGLLAATCKRGDGHPVLVLPGFMTSDNSTVILRRFLKFLGYDAHGWEQGRNYGPIQGVEDAMLDKIDALYDAHDGRKVSLVGWSLGGLYARQLAKYRPKKVRLCISLGSPFSGSPKASNAWKLFEFTSGHKVDDRDHHMGGDFETAPPVPTTAIYTKTDGICAWQTTYQQNPRPDCENILVEASHCGLGHHPSVVYAISDRLAQGEGRWERFKRTGLKRIMYRRPHA